MPAPSLQRKPSTTVMSRRLIEECADRPRKHLGSQLYTTDPALSVVDYLQAGLNTKVGGTMESIPFFEGKENCTFTIRVPRQYLNSNTGRQEPSYLAAICKRRQIWGTGVYTDDSDVVAAAVHSGWLKGDFDELNDDLKEVYDNESEQDSSSVIDTSSTLTIKPRKPVRVPPDRDAHITVLILPPLESYASTNQHHIWSREWDKTHDGMSFAIHQIDFVDAGSTSMSIQRGAKARKARIAAEEAQRRDAAASMLMFANGKASEVSAPA